MNALDKDMLIGALKNDQNILQEQIGEATKIGKLIGKAEFVSGLISILEKGSFDFVSKEDCQEVVEKQMDKLVEGIRENSDDPLREVNPAMLHDHDIEDMKKL